MSLVIEGKDGQKLAVTNRNMARALATGYSIQADATIDLQRSWSILDTQTPTGAGDVFFYLRNGGNRDLIVTRVDMFGATAETTILESVTGTAVGGTVLPFANRVIGSNRQPQPGVEAQSGVDITGLSTSAEYERLQNSLTLRHEKELQLRPLVVRPNFAIALRAVVGAIAIDFAIDFMEQVIEPQEVL